MLEPNNEKFDFFHSLIPKKLRESTNPQSSEYIKIRALSAMLVFFIIFQVIQLSFAITWHISYAQALLEHNIYSIVIFLIFAIQTAFYYRFANYWLTALAFTSFYFLIIVMVVIMSGGHESPMKILLLTCPLVAFVVGDKQEGIQVSILIALVGMVLAYLNFIEFETPNIFADANPSIVFSIDWTISLFILILTIIVYETALHTKDDDDENDISNNSTQAISAADMGAIDTFFHNLLPPSLRLTLPANSTTYVRARFLSICLFALVFMSIISIFPIMFMFWLLDSPDQAPSLIENLIGLSLVSVFVIQLWLYNRFGDLAFSSICFTNSYFVVVMLAIVGSGGYDSPIKYFLLTCPLIAFVVGGKRAGMQNSLYTWLTGILLAALNFMDVELQDYFMQGNNHFNLIFSTNWVVTVVMITSCLIVYETELQRRFKANKNRFNI